MQFDVEYLELPAVMAYTDEIREILDQRKVLCLHRVIGWLSANSINNGTVHALFESKRNLTVEWLRAPTEVEKEVVRKAWFSEIGGGWADSTVTHVQNPWSSRKMFEKIMQEFYDKHPF